MLSFFWKPKKNYYFVPGVCTSHFFFLLKSRNTCTLWTNLIYPFSDIFCQVRNVAYFFVFFVFTRLTSVTCFQFESRIRFLLIFMHLFFFLFIIFFLFLSERWVRPTSYQHFCRCSWWSCMLLLVIRLWRTSLHTLAKHRHPWQNERKKKGSVMNKSLFSLSLRNLTHRCTQTSSRPTQLQGIVVRMRLVPSILLDDFFRHSQPSWQ